MAPFGAPRACTCFDQLPRSHYCTPPFLALLLLLALLARPTVAVAQRPGEVPAIYSGTPWFDDRGQVVNAHGANLVRDKARYYLFGEAHSDTSNVFASFTATLRPTSALGWKFERVALPAQPTGKLGPGRVTP
jgi:hypothetical protein